MLLGGGAANFLPQAEAISKRKDDVDYIAKFRDSGYAYAATATELDAQAAKPETRKLLGLFAPGNMDGVLDRKFLKGGGVKKSPDQPDLTVQLQSALNVLSRNDNGFFLMVESGMIDKYAHALDMERAVYDTIMLDNAVKLAKDWAKARGEDTLILVLADHNHPNSLVGTVNDDMETLPNTRCANGLASMRRPASRTIRSRMPRAIRRASMSAAGWRFSPPAFPIITRRCGRSSTTPTSPRRRATSRPRSRPTPNTRTCPARC